MLQSTAVDQETFKMNERARNAIVRVAQGNPSYDDFDSPLNEEDRERARLATVTGDPHQDLGPPQEETIPLEDGVNPFPMLAPPVEL